jgi:hypothetical protein
MLRVLLFSLLIAGCQCQGSLDDDAGSGSDAGVSDAGIRDAGVSDAGAGVAGGTDAGRDDAGVIDAGLIDAGSFDAGSALCTTATSCTARAIDAGFCRSVPPTGTCAFGQCVSDCTPALTCTDADGGCVLCNGSITCPARGQLCRQRQRLFIEASTCPKLGLGQIELVAQPDCTFTTVSDGGLTGRITFHEGITGLVVGDFPSLGGRCVGQELPTGAIRYTLACPDCWLQFM